MTRREQLQMQYEAALFAILMDDFAVLEGKQALQENERLQSNPAAEVPEKIKNHSQKTIKKFFSAKTARAAGRITAKVAQHIMVAGFVVTLLFTVAFASSSNFRINTLNFFVTTFDDRMVISSGSTVPQQIYTNWMPEGYEQTVYDATPQDVTARYQTSDGKEIRINIWDQNRNTTIDTENAEVGTVDINGTEAVTIFKQGIDDNGDTYESSTVIWVDPIGCFVEIHSYHETVDTLIQIAQALVVE